MARLYRRPNKSGGKYYIDYFEDGNRVRRSLNTTVLKIAKQRRADILRGKLDLKWGRDTKDIPAAEFWTKYTDWARDHKSPRTVERETTHWEQFLEYLEPESLGSVTRQDVEKFKKHLIDKRKLANVTVNDTLRRLQALYNRAKKMEWYDGHNPFNGVDKLPTEERDPKYLTADQRDALIEAARKSSRDVYLFCALCAFTGMRTKEAVYSRWEWFDFEQGSITVKGDHKGEFTTKSKKFRTIPLHTRLRDILEPLRRDTGYLLKPEKTEPGKWRIRYEPRGAFRTVAKEAGVLLDEKGNRFCTPHVLRHTFASLLVNSGVSLYKVSRWLGHKDFKTTQIYAHLEPQDDDIDRG